MNESQKHWLKQKKSDSKKCILTFKSEATMVYPRGYIRMQLETRTGSQKRNLEQICRFIKGKRVDEITKKEGLGRRKSKPKSWVNISILGTHRERKVGEGHREIEEEGGGGIPEESDSLENKSNNSGREYSMSKTLEG